MREFTFENQAFGSFLTYRLALGEELDRMAMGMLTYNSIPGMLPVSCMYVDTDQIVRFKISSLTGLMGYWGGVIGRKKLLAFLSSFCQAVLECQEYMLDPSRLLLSWEHVFVEPLSGEVRLAYLPVVGGEAAVDNGAVGNFLRDLIQRTTFDPSEDGSHVAVIFNALKDTAFSVEHFQKQLQKLMGAPTKRDPVRGLEEAASLPVQKPPVVQTPPARVKEAQPPVSAPPVTPEKEEVPALKGGFSLLGGKGGKEQKSAKANKAAKNSGVKGLGFAVPGMTPPAAAEAEPEEVGAEQESAPAKEKKSLFGFGKKKEEVFKAPPAEEPSVEQPVRQEPPMHVEQSPVGGGRTTPLGGAQGAGRTMPLGEMDGAGAVEAAPQRGGKLCLVRRLNGQRAVLDKPIFHVGRESRVVDFRITGGHNWVGSDHAYFLKKEDGWYLVDNNSLNHTWLNGQQLVSNTTYPVSAGDVIKMADEEFDLLPG